MNLTEILAHKYNLVVDYFDETKHCPSAFLDGNCPLKKPCIDCLTHTVKPKFHLLYSNMFKHESFKKYVIDNNLEFYIKIKRDNLEKARVLSKGKITASYDKDSDFIRVISLCDMNFKTKNYFYIIRNIDDNYYSYVPIEEAYYFLF